MDAWFSKAHADAIRAGGAGHLVAHGTADGLHAMLATSVGDAPREWADAVPLGPVGACLGTWRRPRDLVSESPLWPGRRLTRAELEASVMASTAGGEPLAVPIAMAPRLVAGDLTMREVGTAAMLAITLVRSVRTLRPPEATLQ